MKAYIVYPQGQRPWPDEVNLLTEAEMREAVQQAILSRLEKMSENELISIANAHGVEVQEVS